MINSQCRLRYYRHIWESVVRFHRASTVTLSRKRYVCSGEFRDNGTYKSATFDHVSVCSPSSFVSVGHREVAQQSLVISGPCGHMAQRGKSNGMTEVMCLTYSSANPAVSGFCYDQNMNNQRKKKQTPALTITSWYDCFTNMLFLFIMKFTQV